MDLASAVRAAKSIITANSPVLLVGTAIAGVVSTGVLAAWGGYKARGIVDTATVEKGSELTQQEKIRLTWLCYAAPAATGVSTIASVLGVHTIHTKRHAALAGLYAVATNKLDDYRDKAEELLGTKKSQELNNTVAQKAIDRRPIDNREVIVLDGGTELCYDDWSGRYFMGSVPMIEKAFNKMNMNLAAYGEVTLNDFYDDLGLTPIPMGMNYGWSGQTTVEPKLASVLTSDGRSAISFGFHQSPRDGLGTR